MMPPMRSRALHPTSPPASVPTPAPAPPAPRPRALVRAAAIALAALAALAVVAAPAAARKKPKTYYFEVADVRAADEVGKAAAEVVPITAAQLAKAITAHAQLVDKLDGAPDRANARAFKAWLKKKKLDGAYRVNVELTGFEEELEDKDESLNQEKRLVVRLSLRTFGETIPDRVMAFSGEGSATIKVDVGKRLRPRDREYAISEAVQMALAEALASSLKKLAAPPPPPKK